VFTARYGLGLLILVKSSPQHNIFPAHFSLLAVFDKVDKPGCEIPAKQAARGEHSCMVDMCQIARRHIPTDHLFAHPHAYPRTHFKYRCLV